MKDGINTLNKMLTCGPVSFSVSESQPHLLPVTQFNLPSPTDTQHFGTAEHARSSLGLVVVALLGFVF